MTTIGHGIVPVTACVALTIAPFGVTPLTIAIAGVSSILTALWSMDPDIIGIKGGSRKGDWKAYNSAHFGEIAIAKIQLPWWRVDKYFYEFHLWLDRFFHNQEEPYGWKPIGYVLEVLIDAACLASLILVTDLWFTVGIVLALILYFVANIIGAKDAKA